jgi:hypothetical protein
MGRYGQETPPFVPYDVSKSGNSIRYDDDVSRSIPYPYRRFVSFRGGGGNRGVTVSCNLGIDGYMEVGFDWIGHSRQC